MSANTINPLLTVEFLYLDLRSCDRCMGTKKNLYEAIRIAGPALEEMGIVLHLEKIHISSEGEARAHSLPSSPTIRINGTDIAAALVETECAACGELCGCADGVDCRIWQWNGTDYTAAPVGMILQAMMREALHLDRRSGTRKAEGREEKGSYERPENLRRFFATKNEEAAETGAECCPTDEMETCCAPSEKETCCAPTSPLVCACV